MTFPEYIAVLLGVALVIALLLILRLSNRADELDWALTQADQECDQMADQLADAQDLIAQYESAALVDHYAQLPDEVRPLTEADIEDSHLMFEIDTYLESQ